MRHSAETRPHTPSSLLVASPPVGAAAVRATRVCTAQMDPAEAGQAGTVTQRRWISSGEWGNNPVHGSPRRVAFAHSLGRWRTEIDAAAMRRAIPSGAELNPAEIATQVNQTSEGSRVVSGIRWAQNPVHTQTPFLVLYPADQPARHPTYIGGIVGR